MFNKFINYSFYIKNERPLLKRLRLRANWSLGQEV